MSTEKSSTTSKKIAYPTYEMESKGRLILPVEIINQIMYLHSSIGKTEWSGLLLYDVMSGNPSKPSDFVLKAKHIFLMDVGSAAYTEYETDGDIVDLYDNIEGAMEMKMGHVHSHHDMNAFFSGTDTDELMQNADKHNYYLSLIVNFSGNYVAKVAFLSERKLVSWMHYTDDHGELKKFKEETNEKTMIVVNMIIQLEYNNQFFYNRITDIKDKKRQLAEAKKAAEKANEKKYKGREAAYQKSFYGFDEDFKEMYEAQQRGKANPLELSTADVEALTRNMLSVNADLTESKSVYNMLHTIAEAKNEELKFYYDFFEDNIENILNSYFKTSSFIKADLEAILKEVIMSIQRFKYHKKLESIIPEIVRRINSFYKNYEGSDNMDSELEQINKAIQSYGKD